MPHRVRLGKSTLLEASNYGQVTVLRVNTEIDFSSGDALDQAMKTAASSGGHVVVDLGPCAYLDSSCLAILVRQHRALGTRLSVVVPPTARTRRIFEVSGLLDALPIVESVAEATDGRIGLERNVQ